MFSGYVMIEGIPGESTAKGFENQLEILSFSHGVHQTASMSASTAGGATSGKSDHSDFSIVKQIDKASPLLAQRCSDGKHIPSIVVTLCRAGGEGGQVIFMTYTMTECIVSNYRPGGSSGGDNLPLEEVSLNYGKIEWEYTQQKRKDGTGGGKVKGSWNLQTVGVS